MKNVLKVITGVRGANNLNFNTYTKFHLNFKVVILRYNKKAVAIIYLKKQRAL